MPYARESSVKISPAIPEVSRNWQTDIFFRLICNLKSQTDTSILFVWIDMDSIRVGVWSYSLIEFI